MSSVEGLPVIQYFADISGKSLDDGFVYIGTSGLDPVANPISVFWDAALTIPAPNPIRTRNGHPDRSGVPSRFFVDTDSYSFAVKNKNGTTVYNALDSLSATDIERRLRNSTDPAKGAGIVGYRERDVYLKLSDWVASSDFAGSDSAALIAAEAHCFTNGKTLHIDKNLSIPTLSGPIDFRCSVVQQPGTEINIVNTSITGGLFRFKTAQIGTVKVGVSGLTEGSTKLTGLGIVQPGSWLIIESAEELIKDTSAGFYVKQEIAVLADASGGLTAPLNTTYSAPTITLFTPEPPLLARGLNIIGDGSEITDTNLDLVEVFRMPVKINDLSITSVPNQGAQVRFGYCPPCELNNPKIEGHTTGNGYGVLAFMTEGLSISNPNVYNCRHAYSGRHDKNTKIHLGSMSEIIDSHWGQNLIVDGVNLIGQVQYAGRDLTVINGQQTPMDYGIRIRNTSPELKGRVIYHNNTVNVDASRMAGTHFAYLTSGLSSGTFVFGRNLQQPDLVSIKNNHLNIIGTTPTNISYARMLTNTGFEYDLLTRFEIDGNTRTDYAKTIDFLAGFTKADNVAFTRNPKVIARNEKNCRISVTSLNTAARLGEGFELDFSGLEAFILFMNPNAIGESRLTNIACSGWALPTGGAQANVDNGHLKQLGMSFSGAVPVEISRIMRGEIFFRSMPDDTASYFTPGHDFGHLSVVTQNSLAWSGLAAYDAQTAGAFNQTIFAGANFATTAGILSGTTGADTFLTISPHTDNRVYVENRAGAALTIQIKEFNFGQ